MPTSSKSPSTDLITIGSDSAFLALQMDESELTALVESNLGGKTLDTFMLDRVKLPTGGGTTWEVPTLDGEIATKELEGVIIDAPTRRTLWAAKYGQGEAGAPPICSSQDGIVGSGEPGGSCAGCRYNVFGTDFEEGPGKRCKEFQQLFLLQPDSLIPIIINATPGSLKDVGAYFVRLLRAGLMKESVTTKLTLVKAQNKAGLDYSKIVCSVGVKLDVAATVRIRELAAKLAPVFAMAAQQVDQEDING